MKHKLGLYDPNSRFNPAEFSSAQWFTRPNFQASDARILKRLDRAMLAENDSFFFARINPVEHPVAVMSSTSLFDHSPIVFQVEFSSHSARSFQSQFYLNTSFLEHDNMRAHIFHIWNLIPYPSGSDGWIAWWNNAIIRTTGTLRTLGVEFAKRRC